MGTRSKYPPKTRVMPPEELQGVAQAYRNGNRKQRRMAKAKLRVHVREASGQRQQVVWRVPPQPSVNLES